MKAFRTFKTKLALARHSSPRSLCGQGYHMQSNWNVTIPSSVWCRTCSTLQSHKSIIYDRILPFRNDHKDLLAAHIQQLQKRPEDLQKAAITLYKHRLASEAQFEQQFHTRLCKDSYSPELLVLIHNTAIEKELNRKTKPRYMGPYEVVCQTSRGAYILKKLDNSIKCQTYAAFRIVPYISRNEVTYFGNFVKMICLNTQNQIVRLYQIPV